MNLLSLFAGIGGFDLGFERAGMTCAGQVENAKFPLRVLAHHWPDVKRMEDIRDVRGDEFGTVDVICGGFPCQDLSVAGRRAGLAGERSGLFHEAVRIIEAVKPQWVCLENVPGLFSSNGGEDFLVVLRTLADIGYGLAWRVFDSQYFGLAQQRKRVFIVGYFGGPCPPEILFEPESLRGDTPPRREAGKETTTDVARSLRAQGNASHRADSDTYVAIGIDEECNARDECFGPLLKGGEGGTRQAVMCMAHGQDNAEVVSDGSPSLTCNHEAPIIAIQAGREIEKGQNGIGIRDDDTSYTLDQTGAQAVCFQHQNSASCGMAITDVAPSLQTNKEPAVMCYENHAQDSRIKEMGDISPMLSVKAGTGGGNLPLVYHRNASCMVTEQDGHAAALRSEGEHSYQFVQSGPIIRRLTPRECERLQGFPDDWTQIDNKTADGPRYKALGNAVSVPVAEHIGKRIMAYEATI